MAIGIDIGTCTTRVAVMESKGGRLRVTGYARLPTAEILGPEARPGRLSEALLAAGAKRGAATISVSGRDVILKISNYPVVPDWRLRLLIEYEVTELSERAGGDILSAHRVLEIPGRNRNEITALLALAKEPYLEERISLLEESGLKLDSAVPSAVAAGNAFALVGGDDPSHTVLVADIGEETTDVALVCGRSVIFARNANFGGKAFTDAVAETFGVKERTAIKMKEEEGRLGTESGASTREAKVGRALEGAAADLAGLLRSSLKFSQAQLRATDMKIDAIVLTGGVARLPGLDQELSQAMRMPVDVLDLLGLADDSLGAESLAAFKDDGPASATAVGLAASCASGDRSLVTLRLLPARIERRRQFLHHQLFVLLAAGVALFSGLLWYATVANNRDVEVARAAHLRKEADELHALKTNLEESIAERHRFEEARHSWATVIEPSRAVVAALSAVRKHTPSDAYLTAFDLQPRADHGRDPAIVIEGRIRESTRSVSSIYEDFAIAMRALEGFRFTTSILDHDDDGGGLTFSCKLEYVGPVE